MGNCFGYSKNTNIRLKLPAVCLIWEIAMIILFGFFIRYNKEANPQWNMHKKTKNISSDIENDFYFRYPSMYIMLNIIFVISHHEIGSKPHLHMSVILDM